MEISSKLLEKLSRLSALKINPDEKDELKSFLTKALSHFEKIKNIPTEKTPPLISPLEPAMFLRSDQAKDHPHKEKLLEQAPQKQGALVKVPSAM